MEEEEGLRGVVDRGQAGGGRLELACPGGPPVVAVLLRPAGRRARELGADEPAAGLLQGFQVLPLPGQVPAEEHRLHAPEGGAVVERAVAGVTAAWLQRL